MRNVLLYMSMSLDGYVAGTASTRASLSACGQALFGQLAASPRLDLGEARAFSSGVVLHVYRPARGRVGSQA